MGSDIDLSQLTHTERDAIIRRSVSEFHRLTPQLSGFARALTGNSRIRIAPTPGTPCTDGETIYLRPSPALGFVRVHDRQRCGERNPDTEQFECSACATLEEVFGTFLHEIAHIVEGSFEKLTPEAVQVALKQVRAEYGNSAVGDNAERVLTAMQSGDDGLGALAASGVISPYLPLLLNGLEDTRVNERMFEERAGMRVALRAQIREVMTNGVTDVEGNLHKWSDRPVEQQLLIGTFLASAGYEMRGVLNDDVIDVLESPDVVSILVRARTASTVSETYVIGVELLEALRKRGYYPAPDEIPPPPPPPGGDDSGDDPVPTGQEPDDDESHDSPSDGQPGRFDNESSDTDEGDSDGADGESGGDKSDDEGNSSEGDAAENGDSGNDDESGQPGNGDGSNGDGDSDDNGDDAGESDTTSSGDADSNAPGDGANDSESSSKPAGLATDGDDVDSQSDNGKESDNGEPGKPGESAGTPQDSANDPGNSLGSVPTPDELAEFMERLAKLAGHEAFGGGNPTGGDQNEDEDAEIPYNPELERAIRQWGAFDAPSERISWQEEHREHAPNSTGIMDPWEWEYYNNSGLADRIVPEEGIIGPALAKLRAAFSDNRRTRSTVDLKKGKINTRVLATRVPSGDNRVFRRDDKPGKRDYWVLIGVDISGSTHGDVCEQMKSAVMQKAEMLARIGIPFEVVAHTANNATNADGGRVPGIVNHLVVVKEANEPWNDAARDRLRRLKGEGVNLDGHTIEAFRKRAEKRREVGKIILYYTDGAMPAYNNAEELQIMQREFGILKRLGALLVGVGVGTDSPKRHGLDTMAFNSNDDIPALVDGLRKRIEKML